MTSSNKVIITCAVTGAIHTPSMSPHLPVTADEIAEAAIRAAEAGAAIVHLHARDERSGRPDQSPEASGTVRRAVTSLRILRAAELTAAGRSPRRPAT